ncbi:PAS domain-containing sensor histidine kinase [Blastococcus atacamensis]|uniref:PAS domain-containing sensor histidine kinase n=1 Tax=Blastococcus atacamensis TaxID=2070508 RepID=UPI0012FFD6C0|nr:PAS domain-containing sensor histidine kinase [Blastococcus atacamensis]
MLRRLGLDALVEMLETSGYGVCVTGDDHRWVYLNPTGCRLVGRPFAELEGADYLLSFAEHERAYLLALEQDQRDGDSGFYANTIVRPDGSEVGITWSGSVLHADGKELAPAFFHPTFGLARTDQDAVVLGAAPARLAAGGSVGEVLGSLAEEAVARSRAVACLVLVECPDGRLALLAGAGVLDEVSDALWDADLRLTDLPGGDLLTAGRLLLLSDGRTRLAASPSTAMIADLTGDLGWEGSVKVPLHRGGMVVGCLVLLLPRSVTAATKGELIAWSALGAHASVALAEERLREQAAAHAAELERHRLGRDLHDSVIAALFSVHARAQAVQRGLRSGAPGVVEEAARDLEALSQQAIAQLRAMVTGMRPETSTDDLAVELGALARACTTRDGLPVDVRVAGAMPPVAAGTIEHLVRIAGEALHNCVKHAGASAATVSLDAGGDGLVLMVTDDGCGFDPTAGGGGHGQRTMRERAQLCGGSLAVDSAPGRGTRVVVRVPVSL